MSTVMSSSVLEKDIEAYLVKRVKGCGGEAYKFTSPQRSNVPDRLVVYEGKAIFVELKALGKTPTSGQLREHKRLIELGMDVYVLDSNLAVDCFIKLEFGK